jgi:predicted nucleotide-binding protein
MPRINQDLFERLVAKLGLSQSQVYKQIDAKVRATHLPRHLAAIALASERGINISKFASADDLAVMRQTAVNAVPAPVVVQATESPRHNRTRRGNRMRVSRSGPRRGNTVFVVHGRDTWAREQVFAFLRALGLRPLEWSQAIRLVRKGSPYVGEILEAAFREAAAVVVLLTPDDEARLRSIFAKPGDPSFERKLTGQARPNVLFEAGMAFGKDPNSTVLIQIGEVRPFSDVGGRHVVHLSNQPTSRQEFVTKLANAGCNVDTTGADWLSVGEFAAQPSKKTLQRTSRVKRRVRHRGDRRAARR